MEKEAPGRGDEAAKMTHARHRMQLGKTCGTSEPMKTQVPPGRFQPKLDLSDPTWLEAPKMGRF